MTSVGLVLLLPAVATTLVGLALIEATRPPWSRLERLAAGMILGPPVLTLAIFLAWQAGVPYGPAAPLVVLGLASGLLLSARARRRGEARSAWAPSRWWIVALVALLAFEALLLWAHPTPEGDGILNFGVKARALHRDGELLPLLREPRMKELHPSYPPHPALVMNVGFLVSGQVSGLAALAGSFTLLPALALFAALFAGRLATRGVSAPRWARRREVVAGAVALAAVGLTPALGGFARSGYGGPALAGLLLVAARAWLDEDHAWRPGIFALGLLPWIKLEGLAWGGLLGGLAVLDAVLRPAPRWRVLAPLGVALGLALVWPLLAWWHELASTLQQGAPIPWLDRVRAWGEEYGVLLTQWSDGLAFGAWPALAGAALAPRVLAGGGGRRLTLLFALLLVAALLLPVLRGTAVGGTAALRLIAQVLPLGLVLAAAAFAALVYPAAPAEAPPPADLAPRSGWRPRS